MFRDSTSCEFNCKLSLKGLNQSPSNLANYILCTMCTIQFANRTNNWLGDSKGIKICWDMIMKDRTAVKSFNV